MMYGYTTMCETRCFISEVPRWIIVVGQCAWDSAWGFGDMGIAESIGGD
jgi:hypothetical protein